MKLIQAILIPSGLLIINHINEESTYEIGNLLKIFSKVAKSQKIGSNEVWVCVNNDQNINKES